MVQLIKKEYEPLVSIVFIFVSLALPINIAYSNLAGARYFSFRWWVVQYEWTNIEELGVMFVWEVIESDVSGFSGTHNTQVVWGVFAIVFTLLIVYALYMVFYGEKNGTLESFPLQTKYLTPTRVSGYGLILCGLGFLAVTLGQDLAVKDLAGNGLVIPVGAVFMAIAGSILLANSGREAEEQEQ